ncbi:MAG TPA: TIGR02611 family protein, partial [Mycobacteriales bacterium]|nr:TIGR02611 family protein [Mycobacteriales bacterium]
MLGSPTAVPGGSARHPSANRSLGTYDRDDRAGTAGNPGGGALTDRGGTRPAAGPARPDRQSAGGSSAGGSDRDPDGAPGPGRWRDRLRSHPFLEPLYRIGVAVVGFGVVGVGLVLVPFPGPGWLVVFVGLGILATEFAWARRLLVFARARLRSWADWMSARSALFRVLVLLATALVVIAVVV